MIRYTFHITDYTMVNRARIPLIQELRRVFGLMLVDAKHYIDDLVDRNNPAIIEYDCEDDAAARRVHQQLDHVGFTVSQIIYGSGPASRDLLHDLTIADMKNQVHEHIKILVTDEDHPELLQAATAYYNACRKALSRSN